MTLVENPKHERNIVKNANELLMRCNTNTIEMPMIDTIKRKIKRLAYYVTNIYTFHTDLLQYYKCNPHTQPSHTFSVHRLAKL